jgi:hypothetical protein
VLAFLGDSELPAQQVSAGIMRAERARVAYGDAILVVDECAEMQLGDASAALQWFGELSLEGLERPLDEWSNDLGDVLSLFALLSDKALTIERVFARGVAERVDYYASWIASSSPTNRDLPFTLAQVGERLGPVVGAWHALCASANELEHYLAEFQLHRERYTTPDQVLLLVRCLELGHAYSNRFGSVVRPKAEHANLVSRVVEALPDDLRSEHGAWIEAAVKEPNRKRLVEQLGDILESLGTETLGICGIDYPEAFASTAKSARNHYTHPTRKVPNAVPQGRDLHILAQQLWFVVRGFVFMELGFTQEEVADALRRSSRRHYLLR